MSFRAIQQIKSNSGITVGYILMNDDTTETIKMDNKQIKSSILNRKINIYNLKLTQDGKLIHIDSLDRIGKTVPHEQFFSGKLGDWTLSHANNGQPIFKAQHISGKSFILQYSLWNGNRGYIIKLVDDNAILGKEKYIEHIYKDIGNNFEGSQNTVDSFIQSLNKLLTHKITSTEQIEKQKIQEYWDLSHRKANLENEYKHGCSEEALHDLKRLKELEKQFADNPEYIRVTNEMKGMTIGEQIAYLNNYVNNVKKSVSKGTPSEYPGIIYETNNRTRSQYLNSLGSAASDGIHAYNSMEYWWTLNSEEREKEIHDPNSPWYNFEG